jgi:hypothetical protein
VLADAGVENVNAQVDELINTGVLRRLLAFTELKFSNSMIEPWWRSLKHQWLFLRWHIPYQTFNDMSWKDSCSRARPWRTANAVYAATAPVIR